MIPTYVAYNPNSPGYNTDYNNFGPTVGVTYRPNVKTGFGRSILGDPRSPRMQSAMNLKIKFRESFRPFAPSVLAESAAQYFKLECASPYMLLVANVQPDKCRDVEPSHRTLHGIDRLKLPRSVVPRPSQRCNEI